MSKYIIKNCPALYGDEGCKEFTYEDGSVNCKNRTDCLLKQIVEKCKKVDCDCLIDKRKCGAMDSMSMCCELFIKKDILRDLEIEEVNDDKF